MSHTHTVALASGERQCGVRNLKARQAGLVVVGSLIPLGLPSAGGGRGGLDGADAGAAVPDVPGAAGAARAVPQGRRAMAFAPPSPLVCATVIFFFPTTSFCTEVIVKGSALAYSRLLYILGGCPCVATEPYNNLCTYR
jgi:hypothetical protein